MKRYLPLALLIIVIAFISCDGRHRKYDKKYPILNIENSNPELIVNYVPKEYIETVTDTILSTDFRVNIKYYALMDSQVKINKKGIEEYHRNFQSEIVVYKKDKLLFSGVINKSMFKHKTDAAFLDKAILQYVYVDEVASSKSFVRINCSLLNTKTQRFKDFILDIDTKGRKTILRV